VNKRVSLVLFTIAVTVVFIAPITFVHLLTRPIVELNEEVYLKRAVLAAAGLEAPSSNADAKALFDGRVEAVPLSAAATGPAPEPVYRVKDDQGAAAGWVITRTGPGLWGDITAVVGFAADRERLTGIEFMKQSETPGLGARISERWFKEQFRGKRGPFSTVGEGEPTKENEFDAITGATITSGAVKAILNAVVAAAGALPKEATE
jgi:Na+-transporting NADH:ubiquinone oxidoreductase subunit C